MPGTLCALAPAVFCFAQATGITTKSMLLLVRALFSFLCLQMYFFSVTYLGEAPHCSDEGKC